MKPRDWPGNDLMRLTELDRILHDHLCELLSDRMSEGDVCTASVGIWGALSVMRDKLNLLKLETEAHETRAKELNESLERRSSIIVDFNKLVKEHRDLQADHSELKLKLAEKDTEPDHSKPGKRRMDEAGLPREWWIHSATVIVGTQSWTVREQSERPSPPTGLYSDHDWIHVIEYSALALLQEANQYEARLRRAVIKERDEALERIEIYNVELNRTADRAEVAEAGEAKACKRAG